MSFRCLLTFGWAGAQVAGCGCDDIGCNDTVILSVDVERDVARIELQTPDGWVDCDGSKDASCSVTTSAEGTVEFSFRTEPRQKMNVRAHNEAGDLLFEGAMSLSLRKTDPDGADCPAECDVATGALPASRAPPFDDIAAALASFPTREFLSERSGRPSLWHDADSKSAQIEVIVAPGGDPSDTIPCLVEVAIMRHGQATFLVAALCISVAYGCGADETSDAVDASDGTHDPNDGLSGGPCKSEYESDLLDLLGRVSFRHADSPCAPPAPSLLLRNKSSEPVQIDSIEVSSTFSVDGSDLPGKVAPMGSTSIRLEYKGEARETEGILRVHHGDDCTDYEIVGNSVQGGLSLSDYAVDFGRVVAGKKSAERIVTLLVQPSEKKTSLGSFATGPDAFELTTKPAEGVPEACGTLRFGVTFNAPSDLGSHTGQLALEATTDGYVGLVQVQLFAEVVDAE